jgi:DNA primase
MGAKLRYSDFGHRVDIDELVDALGLDLREDGAELRGHCPLPYGAHKNGDTTGKFSINREKRIYGCWVCGGGNLLDLVMAMQDLDPEPATKWMYQFANHEETDEEFMDELDRLLSDPAEQVTPIPYFNERVLDRFDWLNQSAQAMGWATGRGISPEVAEVFKLRYSPAARRTLKEEVYEGPCIYLPHVWRRRLVGWQQRWLAPEDERPRWVPKYTNTPDFPKQTTLYGYDFALVNAQAFEDPVVVVESVPSALFLWSQDVPAICTFGSSVSDDQLRLLRKFPHLIISRDNDPAGDKYVNQLVTYLDRYTRVQALPVVGDWPSADIGDLSEAPDILHEYLSLAYDSVDSGI